MQKNTLAEQAAAELSERIITGRLAPGSRLTEEALCAELGISRTPVRDALRRLESEGLIEALPHRGCRVREWDAESVRQLFDARSRLEAMMLELSLPHLSRAELRRWDAALAQSLTRSEEEQRRISREIDEELHRTIGDCCPNRVLAELLGQLLKRTAPFRNYRSNRMRDIARLTAERRALIAALLAGELERAQRLLAAHVRQGVSAVVPEEEAK